MCAVTSYINVIYCLFNIQTLIYILNKLYSFIATNYLLDYISVDLRTVAFLCRLWDFDCHNVVLLLSTSTVCATVLWREKKRSYLINYLGAQYFLYTNVRSYRLIDVAFMLLHTYWSVCNTHCCKISFLATQIFKANTSKLKTLHLSWISACRDSYAFHSRCQNHIKVQVEDLRGGQVEWIMARQNISALLIDCF